MRTSLVIMFLCLVISNLISQNIYKKGLVAHYKFNKQSKRDSTKVLDETKSNNGKIIGSVFYEHDRFNNPCGALFFDGNVTAP